DSAPAKSIAERIFISFRLVSSGGSHSETLADAEARVSAVHPFGKIDAHRAQTELRHVEAYAETGIAVQRPVGGISRDSVRVRVEQRVRTANVVIEFVHEDRQRDSPVERDGLAQLDLAEVGVRGIE